MDDSHLVRLLQKNTFKDIGCTERLSKIDPTKGKDPTRRGAVGGRWGPYTKAAAVRAAHGGPEFLERSHSRRSLPRTKWMVVIHLVENGWL
jgi:hypothetical protein